MHSFDENTYFKKCIPFTPKVIEIEIENLAFRCINRDFILKQNGTALALLLEDVAPVCSDEAPGQRHGHHVASDAHHGGAGVLLADLCGVQAVLQIPESQDQK